MRISRLILRLFGWKVSVTVPDFPKCVICVAPHTSNWDFILGKLAYASVGRHAGFLMKEQWFFWPLGCLFRAIGGVPVPRRNKRGSLTAAVCRMFDEAPRLQLAITPEGTRSRTSHWHTGFLHIAYDTGVPIVLGVIDYPSRRITVDTVFEPTGDPDADLRAVKAFYRPYAGKYPEKFSTDEQ